MIRVLKKIGQLATIASLLILTAVILAACTADADDEIQSPDEDYVYLETVETEDQQTTESPITEPAPIRPDYITILGEQFSTDLTVLSLDGPLTNEDILPLKYMTELKGLWIGVLDPFHQITDLSPLAGLTNLEDISLNADYVTDISAFAGLTNLRSIHLVRSQVSDLSPLAGLTNLVTLQFAASQITDITPLAGLTNLTSLDLSWNQISDITPLAGLTNLHSIWLPVNQITDITPLAAHINNGRSNLLHLRLSDNQISDLTSLTDFEYFDSLWLDGNPITDFSPIAHIHNIIFDMELP